MVLVSEELTSSSGSFHDDSVALGRSQTNLTLPSCKEGVQLLVFSTLEWLGVAAKMRRDKSGEGYFLNKYSFVPSTKRTIIKCLLDARHCAGSLVN